MEHPCKVLLIFLLWYKGLLYKGHFLQSLTNISCLSPISFLSDLFIPNKKYKATKNCSNIVFICEFYAGNPVQVTQTLSSSFKEHTVLKATKRIQYNIYFPASMLLW